MWPFPKRTEDRALWQVGDIYPGPVSAAGVNVTPDTALRLSAVWSCVRLLADVVSTMPVDAFRTGSRESLDPKPALLVAPAAYTSMADWLHSVMTGLLTRGNVYGLVTARSGAAERPSQIELLDAGRVAVSLNAGEVVYRLDGRQVDRSDLWHVAAFRVPGSPVGLSPIDYAAETVGLGLAAQQYGARFFGDDATPSGLLTTEQTLNQQQASSLHEQWKARRGGKRGTAVLGNGTKFQAISVAPEESQFLDAQRFTVQQVCRVFGVPPEMVGADSGSSLTYSNVESRDLSLLKYTVGPWLTRLETALSDLLPRGQVVKFNAGSLLRTDLKSRYESYALARAGGWLTLDEIRDLEDREPLPAIVGHPAVAPPQLGSVA